jgi:hypothetical protein
MFAQTTAQVIYYRITHKVGAVRLKFWEDAPADHVGLAHYLYVVNCQLSSVEEAYEVLREYLFLNGVSPVDQLEFPWQGCISVLPYPTWPSYPSHGHDHDHDHRHPEQDSDDPSHWYEINIQAV